VDPNLSRFTAGVLVPGTPYEAVVLLGVGGMGSVYEVKHRVLGRRFVLKALHGQLASRRDLVARMANEWRTLGALNHKNIVSVTDAGFTSDGVPYYVMERLEGETLAELLRRVGRLEPRTAALFTLDILGGLAAAHGIGAIHRDVKPQNVFVSAGMAKVLDFGVAKLRDKASRVITAAGLTVGTPRYMSPEQAAGHDVDARTDIYAVGLVFFEMLTGRSPFSHVKEPHELVLSQMSEEPPRADWVHAAVPAEVADLIHRWLSKNPRARPHSAEAAAQELHALLGALPPSIDPTHVTEGGQYDAETVGPSSPRRSSERPVEVGAVDPTDLGVMPTESALHPPDAPRIGELFVEGRIERGSDQTDRALPAVTRGGRVSTTGLRVPWFLAACGVAFLVVALGVGFSSQANETGAPGAPAVAVSPPAVEPVSEPALARGVSPPLAEEPTEQPDLSVSRSTLTNALAPPTEEPRPEVSAEASSARSAKPRATSAGPSRQADPFSPAAPEAKPKALPDSGL
jgi:eukaryotic-like serine/threonine-protein kinase